MSEENIIFQYQLKKRTKFGTRYYYFYATTDIENYLNNKDIKYVRYAKDTALNKQQKRIRELFKENQQLKEMFEDSKTYSKQFLYKNNKNLLEANEKLQQQRDKYREVFIELKTKILGLLIIIDEQDFLVSEEELEKLLQILDKVKVGDKNE